MGFWDIFQRKVKDNRINHDLDSEDRELSLKTRQAKAALREKQFELEAANLELKSELERTKLDYQLEKAKQDLEDLRGDDDTPENTDDSILDKMLLTFMTTILTKNNTPVSVPVTSGIVTTSPTITQEQIQEFWSKLPKAQQKQIKKLNDLELSRAIDTYLPATLNDKDKDKVKSFIKAQK